jgi:glucan biosynthesis protein C
MASRQRIYHLDAVRCFCMLFGLMVHGSTIGEGWLFEAIKESSEHFRMAAFFLVSGFFTTLVCSRSEFHAFAINRSRMILLPLAAGLVLLNPITNWLIHWFHGQPMSLSAWFGGGWRQPLGPPAQSNWHLHLWFLFSLFAYAMLTPLLLKLARVPLVGTTVDALTRRMSRLLPALLALAVGIATVLLRALHDQLLHLPDGHPFHYVVMATLAYFPFFAIGSLAFVQGSLFESLHRLPLFALALFGIAYLGHDQLAAGLPHWLERASFHLSKSGFIFLIVCSILWLARKLVTNGSPTLSMLTSAVYSFYIFHFLAIYLIATAAQMLTGNIYLVFAAILVIGYPSLLWVHRRFVEPVPFMAWLWNGKPLRRQAAPAG